jgi:retinol dehydrogenase 12
MDAAPRTMQGKIVVITGATSGIGQLAAEMLAAMGARIVQVARDKVRGEAAMARLRKCAPGVTHNIHYADLARLGEMKRAGAEIARTEPRVDVLINNAGAMFNKRQVTEDGLELTFALNHMAYFVFTHSLRERLVASAPARVINTSSVAHKGATLDFDDLQSEREYGGFKVYSRSKLANILFTRELSRRLTGTGVTANALHPGFVATRFGDQSGGLTALGIRFAKLFAIRPEDGAETLVYLASSSEVAKTTGQYFYKSRPSATAEQAQDDIAAHKLWVESERISGLKDGE